MLDELERSLLEIVHSPSRISAADLERIRRRIDAAALLFKVRVMSDELRQREQPATRSDPAIVNHAESQLMAMTMTRTMTRTFQTSLVAAALAACTAAPAGAQSPSDAPAMAAKMAALRGAGRRSP